MQEVSVIIAICIFVWYLRKDSKDDYVRLDSKLEAWRNESASTLRAIQEEIKDFHGRMCALEERRLGKRE